MEWEHALRLAFAVVIGCVIGIEREWKNRPAGMRTHVLVCVGAAMIAIMESLMIEDTMALNLAMPNSGIAVNYGRISAQVVSGIGFLGAGTIFVARKKISGLTTAASLWNVACLGLACGMGCYTLAAIGCVIVLVTLTVLQKVLRVKTFKSVEITFIHRLETLAYINKYFEENQIKVLDVDFHMENRDDHNVFTNLYTLDMKGKTTYTDVVQHLSEYRNIQGIRTRNT